VAADPDNFSVMLGGPLYQIYRRARLAGESLDLVTRRQVVMTVLVWFPLLVLSLLERHAWGGARQPFLLDIDVHARLLIALPLLIFAERHVHGRMRGAVRQFVDRGLVDDSARPKFDAAITSARRLSDSPVAELLLVAFVYLVGGAIIWRHFVELATDSWYRSSIDGVEEVTLAGWWYGLISLPLFQFILFRWYYRLGIWAWFLLAVSRSGLKLVPTHPDMSGGLGFLGAVCYAFIPLFLAHGALFAGVIGSGIFFDDRTLPQYWLELITFPAIVLLFAVGPLLVFVPTLARLKRTGLREYGAIAQEYVRSFDQKWVHPTGAPGQPFLGSADIQSLADLGQSYQIISGMRLVPISWDLTLRLAGVTLLPIAPLALTIIPARELAMQLLKWLF